MKAILLIDHGSRRAEANEMLHCVANMVQHLAGDGVVVRPAHMELAEPTIAQGFSDCVEAGATEVIAFPYMMSPGRHSIEHIPEMVADASRDHPGIEFQVTPAFGVHEKLAELILLRTGIAHESAAAEDTSDSGGRPALPMGNGRWPVADNQQPRNGHRCWHPEGRTGACGDACRTARTAERALLFTRP